MSIQRTVDVAPLRKLPSGLHVFSYSVPSELSSTVAIGTVVKIPFKAGTIFGIVVKEPATAPAKTKLRNVLSVTEISLSSTQMRLAEWLSKYYYSSLGSILHSFIPDPVQKKRKELKRADVEIRSTQTIRNIKAVPKDSYVLYSSYVDIYSLIIAFGKKTSSRKQMLVVVPEHEHGKVLNELLQKNLSNPDVVVLPTRIKKNEFYVAWNASKSASVVIATLPGLFLPFTHLDQVIILEAESQQFQKSEQQPHYHIADFLAQFVSFYKAHLVVTGFSPDISLLYAMQKFGFPVKQIGEKRIFSVVDMNNERAGKNYTPLSEYARDLITKSKKSFIMLNRLGDERILQCYDCQHIVVCLKCDKALRVNDSSALLDCVSCSSAIEMIATCPICNGTRLKSKSKGLKYLLQYIKSEFPKNRIAVVSSDQTDNADAIASSDIVIGTSAIFFLYGQSFDVGVIANIDIDLARPNLHSVEYVRHALYKAASKADEIIVQTYQPDHYIFNTLGVVPKFYDHEIKWRKRFSYPPFKDRVKVSIKAATESEFEKARVQLVSAMDVFEYFGPFDTIARKYRESHVFVVKNADNEKKIAELARGTSMLFEVNPYEIG